MTNIIDSSVISELKEMGGQEFLSELIEMFLQQSETIMDEIKTHSSSKDALSLSKSAHKLKGSCLNLGAQEMSNLCQNIEYQGKENNLEGIDEKISKLVNVYNETATELKKLL
ncbi:MAG: Hpt domain-containing protein [Candidatus Sericytochromatia bacterium]